MPDHLHLVHFDDAKRKRHAVARLLGAFGRHRGLSSRWQIPEPTPIVGYDKLLRQLRYVHPRAGLTSDPLAWPWSTHRDAIGAVYHPWLPLFEIELEFGLPSNPRRSREREFHRYVSSDPSVHPLGSPFPKPCERRAEAELGLSRIWSAVAAASPWCSTPTKRERFVALARHQGWQRTDSLGQMAGISTGQARRILRRASNLELYPATLCLGDARLHDGEARALARLSAH